MAKQLKDSENPHTVGSYFWLLTCEIHHMHHLRARELRGYLREAKFTLDRAERLGHVRDYGNRLSTYQSICRQLLQCTIHVNRPPRR